MTVSEEVGTGHPVGATMVVGLTGGIGSGKSTVAAEFEKLGVPVVDADAIAHALTASSGLGIAPIRSLFGEQFIGPDGAMDRQRMRAHVFENPPARAQLEAILHPMIRAETARQLAALQAPYCLLMIPLLVEAAADNPRHWRDRYDRILVADCNEETQIRRVMARNGFDQDAVRRIMDTQANRAQRLGRADDVIDNNGDLAALKPQVAGLHQRYLGMAARRR